jgi:hypothetical protein
MKIRKNLVRRHLDAISSTKRDTLRSVALFFKIKRRTTIINEK